MAHPPNEPAGDSVLALPIESRPLAAARPGTLAAAATVALLAVVVLHRAWVSDDAYITFRTVANVVTGYGPRWNIGERVQAYTHPLWMWTLVPLYAVTREPYFTSLAASLALTVATGWLLVRRAAVAPFSAAVAVAILGLSSAFVDYSTSGLEGALSHLLLLLFCLSLWKTDGAASVARTAALASLVMLTRQDLGLLVVPPLVVRAWRLGARRTWRPLVLGLLPLAAWLAFSVVYYGFPVPNTAFAKLKTGVAPAALISQGGLYFADSFQRDPITLLALGVIAVVMAVRADSEGRALACGLALYAIYILRVGGDFMSGRFFAAPLVVAAAYVAHTPFPRRFAARAAVFGGLLAAGAAGDHPTVLPDAWGRQRPRISSFGIADERVYYAHVTGLFRHREWLRAPRTDEPARVAKYLAEGRTVVPRDAVGFFGYAAGPRLHVVDVLGLADPLLARLPSAPGWRIGHYYRAIPPGYLETIATGVSSFRDSGVSAYYRKLSLITAGPLFSRKRIEALVGMNTGRFERWIDGVASGYRLVWLEEVARARPDGLPSDDPGVIAFGSGLIVEIGRRISGNRLELTLGGGETYSVSLRQRHSQTWSVETPADGTEGTLTRRVIPLPPGVIFDRIVILPGTDGRRHGLGHLIVVE